MTLNSKPDWGTICCDIFMCLIAPEHFKHMEERKLTRMDRDIERHHR